MKDAKLKATDGKGLELRYAWRRDQCWPGYDRPLGLGGYWIGDGEDLIHLGRKVNPGMLASQGLKPVKDGDDDPETESRNVGYNRMKDSEGRPMQAKRSVRNRLSPCPEGGRLVYRRTIRNIIYVRGKADWLLESIPLKFSAIGYCKFPDDPGAGMVALEVMGGKEIGWTRIDPYSVEYDEETL